MKEHHQTRIIFRNRRAFLVRDSAVNPPDSKSGDGYRSQAELASDDHLLSFPQAYNYAFGKMMRPGRV